MTSPISAADIRAALADGPKTAGELAAVLGGESRILNSRCHGLRNIELVEDRWQLVKPQTAPKPAPAKAPEPRARSTRHAEALTIRNAYLEWHAGEVMTAEDFRRWWQDFERQHGGEAPRPLDWEARVKHLRTTHQLVPEPVAEVAPEPPAKVVRIAIRCRPELPPKMYRYWEITDASLDVFSDWFEAEYALLGRAPYHRDWIERQRRAA